MKALENTIANGLQQALDTLNQFHVTDLSDELITVLLGLMPLLGKWFIDTETEAISRAQDGVCFDGYVLKEGSRRKIVDEQGAIDALRAIDPELVPLCQNTTLAGIKELQSRLGKARFESIFGPFMETRTWNRLVPGGTSE